MIVESTSGQYASFPVSQIKQVFFYTETNPYNVATVLQITKALADGEVINDVYTKGYICQIDNLDTGNYGNAIYWICDDPNGNGDKFKAYRVKGADGKDLKEGYTVPKGATVIVSGQLVNYRGNTPETAQNTGTLISVNGQAPEIESEGGNGETR